MPSREGGGTEEAAVGEEYQRVRQASGIFHAEEALKLYKDEK